MPKLGGPGDPNRPHHRYDPIDRSTRPQRTPSPEPSLQPPASPRPRARELSEPFAISARPDLPPTPGPSRSRPASPFSGPTLPPIGSPGSDARGDLPSFSTLTGPLFAPAPIAPPQPFGYLFPGGSGGAAEGGFSLPPFHAAFPEPRPPTPPHVREANARFEENMSGPNPPRTRRVAFAGPGGERIPLSETPPPPTPRSRFSPEPELRNMVANNYDIVHREREDLQGFFHDVVANPMSDAGTKRRELGEELARLDADAGSQHLTDDARTMLRNIGHSRPDLVDPAWFTPLRPITPHDSPPASPRYTPQSPQLPPQPLASPRIPESPTYTPPSPTMYDPPSP